MTRLEHGHGGPHAYVVAGEADPHAGPMVLDHGHGGAHAYVTASRRIAVRTGPLYHGTSAEGLSDVLPASQHGRETFSGLSSPDHAYATSDLAQARQYADLSSMIHGGRPRVYEVHHLGPEHELEPDPGYAPDVRSRHGFGVTRELRPEEIPPTRFRTATRRTSAAKNQPVCPSCQDWVSYAVPGGWEHVNGTPMCPTRLGVESHQAQVKLSRLAFMPTKRLFGPTYGLDTRLFDGDHLKPDVRRYILETLGDFWKLRHGVTWDEWSIVYLAGSEASEWTSETLQGNGDFDVLIGVDYEAYRKNSSRTDPAQHMTDEEITAELNAHLKKLTAQTDPTYIVVDGKPTGPWSNTWYVNQDSYDIRKIKPYAAYDVTHDRWAVKPPHLPTWDISQFPEGPALVAEAEAVSAYVRAILAMPEPYRTQQGYALWHHLHSDRSRAFSEQGEGWFDPGNVLEKWLDQEGLWEKLVEIMVRVKNDPSTMNAPKDWSNSPA